MNRDSMKALFESGGEKRFAMSMINGIYEGKISVDDINITSLWKAMGEPSLKPDNVIGNRLIKQTDFAEALSSSAFPKVTGALISKKVQDAYDLEYGIGDQLVTKISSSVKDETIVGFGADNAMKEVQEGIGYEEGTHGDYRNVFCKKCWELGEPYRLIIEEFDEKIQMLYKEWQNKCEKEK